MGDTNITTARLRLWAIPIRSLDAGNIAAWDSDEITVLSRVGSHYLCRVVYGPRDAQGRFHGWIHKRLLKRRDRVKQ